MNDLISKNALLEELKEKVYPEKFGEKCNALDVIYAVLQVIEEQETAYDVDKIIKQLEKKTELAYKRYMDCGGNTPASAYARYQTQYNERKMCLDIVKAGFTQ